MQDTKVTYKTERVDTIVSMIEYRQQTALLGRGRSTYTETNMMGLPIATLRLIIPDLSSGEGSNEN